MNGDLLVSKDTKFEWLYRDGPTVQYGYGFNQGSWARRYPLFLAEPNWILESRPTLRCGGEVGLDYRVRSSMSRGQRRRRPCPSQRNRAIVC
jgi:hypothetical protein